MASSRSDDGNWLRLWRTFFSSPPLPTKTRAQSVKTVAAWLGIINFNANYFRLLVPSLAVVQSAAWCDSQELQQRGGKRITKGRWTSNKFSSFSTPLAPTGPPFPIFIFHLSEIWVFSSEAAWEPGWLGEGFFSLVLIVLYDCRFCELERTVEQRDLGILQAINAG